MNRRDFLVGSAGLAGTIVPAAVGASPRPCPPPRVNVAGGSSVTGACPSGDAEADWNLRVAGGGVQWYHAFTSDDEVSRYVVYSQNAINRWGAGSRNWVRRITSDTAGYGGVLELVTPYVSADPAENEHLWMRPFSCFPGDKGYVAGRDPLADAGWPTCVAGYGSGFANGLGSGYQYWRRGLYARSESWAETKPANSQTTPWQFRQIPGRPDYADFYLQFWYKVSASAFHLSNPQAGKLAFIDQLGGNYGEIIIQSPVWADGYESATNYNRRLTMYMGKERTVGLDAAQGLGGSTTQLQPGHAGSCFYGNGGSGLTGCWEWPRDEWVSFLIHVIPGHDSPRAGYSGTTDWLRNSPGPRNAGIQVWTATASEIDAARAAGQAATYRKVWDKTDYLWWFEANSPEGGNGWGFGPDGFNMFAPSQYMNGVKTQVEWYRRFAQVIFSHDPIPCPQVVA